jgi:hypothetical protein
MITDRTQKPFGLTLDERGGVGPRIVTLCILAWSFPLPLALKPPAQSFFQDRSFPVTACQPTSRLEFNEGT